MKFKDTDLGTIQNRYKRFLSDITLDSGEKINAHVPNTGKMTGCWGKDWKVLVSKSDNPKRKLPYTLELTHNGHTWIGINTSRTNKIVQEALENKVITELKEYDEIIPEQKIFDSRLDFLLKDTKNNKETYLEVKNATLTNGNGLSMFPDAVSTRGQKHLKDLIKIKESGHGAVMLYLVNREDVETFTGAKDIDPVYYELLKEAKNKGVLVLAYGCTITEEEIFISKKIKVTL